MRELFNTLRRCSSLRALSVADNPITGDTSTAIGQAFGFHKSLTFLDLGALHFGDTHIPPIMTALQSNTSLQTLDISGNELTLRSAMGFVEVLQLRNTTLQTLVLGAADVDEHARQASYHFPLYAPLRWCVRVFQFFGLRLRNYSDCVESCFLNVVVASMFASSFQVDSLCLRLQAAIPNMVSRVCTHVRCVFGATSGVTDL
jgi:hypothetical protein